MKPGLRGLLHSFVIELDRFIHPVTSGNNGDHRVGGVEQGLLRFLQVFVVGERQSLHRDLQRGWHPMTRAALPRTSSSKSGFFFCGMALLPVE